MVLNQLTEITKFWFVDCDDVLFISLVTLPERIVKHWLLMKVVGFGTCFVTPRFGRNFIQKRTKKPSLHSLWTVGMIDSDFNI